MRIVAEHALLPSGWARNVSVTVGEGGLITSVTPGTDSFSVPGYLIPGMPNLHSHAFQRAMAGMAEARTHPSDSFWTWRELMYRFAGRITPEAMEDIAAYLYVEMLKAGFTSVAEFHYIHGPDPLEMSCRLVAAAGEAGIAITHLPVLYAYSGFGAQPPTEGQKRFILSVDEYLELLSRVPGRTGIAFHSLRAVDERLMREVLGAADPAMPIHIHVAEQRKEVEACLAATGQRPVQWLLDHFAVDQRWCLVHATHVDDEEIRRVAASGAVVGICPTTEANLGDGIFPASAYAPGRFGIGSDSHVTVGAAEELRLLEYGQRLSERRRIVLDSPYENAAAGGARALGVEAGRIEAGQRADLVVLDAHHRAFWNVAPAQVLDAWIFAGDSGCVRDVMVGGSWRVRDRRHPREDELAARFRKAQAALVA